MTTYILNLTITFCLLVVTVILISYCKRRQLKTSHGLTGMCHESGGTMCGGCSSQLQAYGKKVAPDSCATQKTNIISNI